MSGTCKDRRDEGCGLRAYPLTRVLWCILVLLSLVVSVRAQGQNVEVVGQIGGPCWAVQAQGGCAYIGEGTKLRILDVSNPTSPVSLGYILLPDLVRYIYVGGDLAYVANLRSGLQIVDVSNPRQPVLRGAYDTSGSALGVYVSGSLAYVAGYDGGLQIIDVSDPSQPALRGTCDTPGEAVGVYVSGTLAFVADSYNGLQIIDVSDPTQPVLGGIYSIPGAVVGVYVSGNLAFVADKDGGVRVIDVSDPSQPVLRGAYDTLGDALCFCVSGNLAFVGNSYKSLQIIDMSDPAQPVLRGAYDMPDQAFGVYVLGNLAFVADYYSVQIIDVSDPTQPVRRGAYNIPGWACGVYVSGGLAYLAGGMSGLQIMDVSDPTQPVWRGAYNIPGWASDVYVSGGLAYVAGGTSGVLIIDVSDPTQPVWRGAYDTPGDAYAVHVSGGLAYVADYASGLQIIDVSNPAQPVLRGTYSGTPLYTMGVYVSGSLAYVANGMNGLQIVDVSDPTQPVWRGAYDTRGWASDVYVSGSLAYVADEQRGLQIIDVSNPTQPAWRGAYHTSGSAPGACVSGSLAYVADGYSGLQIIDVSDPTQPVLRGAYDTTGHSDDVYVSGNLAYLADGESGLWILRYTGDHPVGPNLTLSDCAISPVAPVQVMPNGPIALGAFIENRGADAAGPFWTEVWGSRTGGLTLDRFLGDSLYLPDGLPGGGAYSWATSTSLYGVPDGPYTVVYAVDRPGEVAESNERDNRAVVRAKRLLVIRPQTVADLAVEGFAMSPNPAQSGGPVAFTGRVVNRGRTITGRFWIEFWGSWDWPYPSLNFFLCDSIFVENLNPGMWVDFSAYPRQLYDVPEGVFMVGCFADRDDSVSESDETNNYQFVDGQVFNQAGLEARPAKASAGADIVVRSADVSPVVPAQLAPGDTITLTVEVANIGTANTGPFWLEYWGSRDGGVTLADFLADSTRLANLAPGQTVRISTAKRLYGIPDGPYSVVVFADRPQDVSETDEANNRLTVAGKRLLVIRPPTGANLVVEDFSQAGATFGGTVRNAGTGDSGPFWIEFWACPGDPDYPWLDRYLHDSIRVNNLAPGGEFSLGFGRATYLLPAGTYAAIAFVDRLDQVAETDETDNYAIVRGVAVEPH